MFFMSGAAGSVLGLLSALQSTSPSGQTGSATEGVDSNSNQSLFSLSAPTSTTPTGSSGGGGWWSSPATMDALLSAQGQSGPDAAGGASGSGVSGIASIERFLSTPETQLGAVSSADPSGATSDSVESQGGHHHGHHGGIEQLLQSLDSQSGTSQTSTNADGSTTTTITNADGSTTTTITNADGSTVTTTAPACSDSSASGTSGTTGTAGSSTASTGNLLERLIQQQAHIFGATTVGQTLSTTA
jgi:hypothetical protein